MSRVTHTKHGVYCRRCDAVHDGTDGCEHGLGKKDGVRRYDDGYVAVPADMGHYSPHMWHEVDGRETCLECGAVKVPEGMLE